MPLFARACLVVLVMCSCASSSGNRNTDDAEDGGAGASGHLRVRLLVSARILNFEGTGAKNLKSSQPHVGATHRGG